MHTCLELANNDKWISQLNKIQVDAVAIRDLRQRKQAHLVEEHIANQKFEFEIQNKRQDEIQRAAFTHIL
jgi:hypothetical protein